jgi:hypothetical protein
MLTLISGSGDDQYRRQIQDSAGTVDLIAGVAGGERCAGEDFRQMQVKHIEKRHEIAAPPDRNRRAGHHVFEYQVPADEPGDDLAERGVAVGVGAAAYRHHRRKFGVAQAGEHAADAGDDERDDDRRAGVLGGGQSGEHEDAGADDAADAERDQRRNSECAHQVSAGRLFLVIGDRFGGEQAFLIGWHIHARFP